MLAILSPLATDPPSYKCKFNATLPVTALIAESLNPNHCGAPLLCSGARLSDGVTMETS